MGKIKNLLANDLAFGTFMILGTLVAIYQTIS